MNDLEILSVILGLGISEAIMILVLGWIISAIPIYFVAKYFNKNLSFPKVLGATILSGIVFLIIAIILTFLPSFLPLMTNNIFLLLIYDIYEIIGLILDFLAVVYIYKTAFNVGWGMAFVISIVAIIIEIILGSLFSFIASVLPASTVNTPVGQLYIDFIGIIGGFMLGLLLSTIFIYLVAKRLNINISFLATSIVNLFPGILSFIIIIISVLLFVLAENNAAFFIGAGIIFIVASIFYKYILNISWRKAILMSIIVSVLWSIIGLFILPNFFSLSLQLCC